MSFWQTYSGCVGTTAWVHQVDSDETHGEKSGWELSKIATCCFEKNPGSSTPQNSCCRATYLPSHKSSKQDMPDSSGEERTNSEIYIEYLNMFIRNQITGKTCDF